MIFTPAPLPGAFIIDPQRNVDERGHFARTFCADEFSRAGLCDTFRQCSTSFNAVAGTLRGLHWQAAPHGEIKLVRATRGAIFDVIVDMREDSPTLHRWFGTELTADNGRALYIPSGFAHGFQTLADASEVFYQIDRPHEPAAARGARWDDPVLAIAWPAAKLRVISARDRTYPDLQR